MTSVVDLWRVVDPEARLVSGAVSRLGQPVRGVARTRSAPPHLPPAADGQLLVVDGALVQRGSLDELLEALRQAELAPAVVIVSGGGSVSAGSADSAMPILVSERSAPGLVTAATSYLTDEPGMLERLASELRLACAEAALADPEPSAPAGLLAARMRRGIAVAADGELLTLHARPAGRALAARFAATHQRLLSHGTASPAELRRRTPDGLWLLERRIRPGASVWLFDDVPLAAADEVAADCLTVTLRALLRRPPGPRAERAAARMETAPIGAAPDAAASLAAEVRDTLIAVARANGRMAPAARALGVHRNTVLYRLRRGRDQLGLDPRRPEDALRILATWRPGEPGS